MSAPAASPRPTAEPGAFVRAPERRPLRVCLVGPSMEILGGQAVVLDRLRARLATVPGIEVSFVPVNPRLPGVLGRLQRVKYVRTVVTSVAYLALLLRAMPRADIVHAFSASYWSFLLAPVPAMLVGRLFARHVVLNYHSGEADDHLANWRTAIPLARLAHRIAVPSAYLVDVFARHGLHAESIHNFVEVERIGFRSRERLQPRFLSNRNLEPLYNVACSIRAFARIQAQVPEATLVVAGDGSERARLEALVRELQLSHVTFTGRVPHAQMSALYDAADIYLNSPDIDNMPSSVIEAYAAGIPVVTTDAGGIPYILRHEATGMLVPCGDDAALANAALRLLREPGLAQRIATQARAELEARYVWPAVRDAWLDLYARISAGQRRSGAAPPPVDA